MTVVQILARPGISIHQKLAISESISVCPNEKLPRIIRLHPKLNTNILDDYLHRKQTSSRDPDSSKFVG